MLISVGKLKNHNHYLKLLCSGFLLVDLKKYHPIRNSVVIAHYFIVRFKMFSRFVVGFFGGFVFFFFNTPSPDCVIYENSGLICVR